MADLHSVPGLTLPLFKVTPTGPRPRDGAPSQSSSLAGTELTLGDSPGPYELTHHSSRGCLALSCTVPLGPENTSSPPPPQSQGLMSSEGPPGARPPGLQTTVGLRAWHGLKMESVPLNAPLEKAGEEVRGARRAQLAHWLFSTLQGQGLRRGAGLLLLPRPEQKGHTSSQGERNGADPRGSRVSPRLCQPSGRPVLPTDLNPALASNRSGFTPGLSTWC